jgi:hypothetical protein
LEGIHGDAGGFDAAENPEFPHPAGDELVILGSEIDDDDHGGFSRLKTQDFRICENRVTMVDSAENVNSNSKNAPDGDPAPRRTKR